MMMITGWCNEWLPTIITTFVRDLANRITRQTKSVALWEKHALKKPTQKRRDRWAESTTGQWKRRLSPRSAARDLVNNRGRKAGIVIRDQQRALRPRKEKIDIQLPVASTSAPIITHPAFISGRVFTSLLFDFTQKVNRRLQYTVPLMVLNLLYYLSTNYGA